MSCAAVRTLCACGCKLVITVAHFVLANWSVFSDTVIIFNADISQYVALKSCEWRVLRSLLLK